MRRAAKISKKNTKNSIHQVQITDLGINGEGIGKIDGLTVYIPFALPGETVTTKLIKVKKNYAVGKLLSIESTSTDRIEAPCSIFGKCGGCHLQHLAYPAQLNFKTKRVEDCLSRIGKLQTPPVKPTIGMEHPWAYRNKMQFAVGADDKRPQIGLYAPRSHRIIDTGHCHIAHPSTDSILAEIRTFLQKTNTSIYNETTHSGLIRHILIRTSQTGHSMTVLVLNGSQLPAQDQLISSLKTIEGVQSIGININTAPGDTILGPTTQILWGPPTLTDTIGELSFSISPNAFFQVNPPQTKVLYDLVSSAAAPTQSDVVWDLYCGTGTIGLYLAPKVNAVIGIESVAPAIENAKANAKANGINTIQFHLGKVEDIAPTMPDRPTTIILDPPRKGCDPGLLKTILEIAPKKIVYVSCDPATLARDLAILNENYQLDWVQPVDMFPQTAHIETVTKLTRF